MPRMTTVKQPYLIFDAGGTLVFPDFPLLTQLLLKQGIRISDEKLFFAHNRMFYDYDDYARQFGRLPATRPQEYVRRLLERAEIPDEIADTTAEQATERDLQRSFWTHTFDWVSQTLAALREAGYRLAVISNADGRAQQIMIDLGLIRHLEIVIDSEVVGVAKPHRAIFDLALEQLDLRPEEAIYVGDLFYIDVWGANQAGLGAIHLDPAGLYEGWPGVRLKNVGQLPAWLARNGWQPGQAELYPARDLPLLVS